MGNTRVLGPIGAVAAIALCTTALVGLGSAAGAAVPGFWQTDKVSVTTGGTPGTAASTRGDVSANGRYVVFQSDSDLTTESFSTNPGFTHVYRRDLQTNTTVLVSVNTAGTGVGDNTSTRPTISGDGCRVAWVSDSSNLVSPSGSFNSQVYLRDLCTSSLPTTLLSFGPGGVRGDSSSLVPQFSDDGSAVVFQSNSGNLLPALGDNNGAADAYLSVISPSGTVSAPVLVSVSDTEQPSSGITSPTVSANGRLVAFSTASAWTPGDPATAQAYVRDRTLGTTTKVSTQAGTLTGANGTTTSPIISADGSAVAFLSTASDLVASDPNGSTLSVFIHDSAANTTKLVDVTSAGIQSNAAAGFSDLGISSDGRFVLFQSGASNLAADTDVSYDRAYIRDTVQGTTALAGASSADEVSLRPTYPIGLSADGGIAAWYSAANGNTIETHFDVYVRNIAKASTAVTLAVTPTSLAAGSAAPTLTGTATAGIAGAIEFFSGGSSIGVVAVNTATGIASLVVPGGLPVGSYSYTAVFTPTAGERTSFARSTTATLTVTPAPIVETPPTAEPTSPSSPQPTPTATPVTQVPVKAVSTVTVSPLPKKVSITKKKLVVRAKVTVVGLATPTGTVSVRINGTTVAKSPVKAKGTVTLTLPTLKSLKKSKKLTNIKPGKSISIVVSYSPTSSTTIASSKSKTVKLKLIK